MLKDVEVKEIVAGVSSPEEIFEINLWMQEQYARDQAILPTRVVSMDVEEICVTHYNWMKMTGELPMNPSIELLKTKLARDRLSGFDDDKWKQLQSLIMIGNGTFWALMISLDLEVISQYNYQFKKMTIQMEEIAEIAEKELNPEKELNLEKELNPEKELEPEKDKLVASRSTCLRSSVPGRICSGVCRGRMPTSRINSGHIDLN